MGNDRFSHNIQYKLSTHALKITKNFFCSDKKASRQQINDLAQKNIKSGGNKTKQNKSGLSLKSQQKFSFDYDLTLMRFNLRRSLAPKSG